MPQKRNPVAIEHARAIGSKALGQAQAIVMAVHNTPFGDIVDTEDDLQPLVSSMFRDAIRAVRLVAAAMQTAEFDPVRLEARAGEGGTTLTELADTLARDHNLPFMTAHAIAAQGAAGAVDNPASDLSSVLAARLPTQLGRTLSYSREDLSRILSPRHFVNVRRHWAGRRPKSGAGPQGIAPAPGSRPCVADRTPGILGRCRITAARTRGRALAGR